MNPAAARFLDQVNDLPTIPKVVSELIASFNSEESGMDRIANLIGSDPVISAKVMRLANSAFCRRPASVSSVRDAVMYIGINPIRTIVLGAGVMGTLKFPARFPRELFWRYSLHTGVASRYFAHHAKMDTDAAFTAGLIHAIGEPMIDGAMREQQLAFAENDPFYDESRRKRESSSLGFCYTDLSADLIERWHFPPTMIDAIRRQAQTFATGDFSREAALMWLGAMCAIDHERQTAMLLDHPQTATVLERLGINRSAIENMPPLTELAQGVGEALH